MSYKVLYHQGDEVSLATKVAVGQLSFEGEFLVVRGPTAISIPFNALLSVELFRLHSTGRMLRVQYAGGTLFISVIRFCLFGYFAVVNFFATGKLLKELEDIIGHS